MLPHLLSSIALFGLMPGAPALAAAALPSVSVFSEVAKSYRLANPKGAGAAHYVLLDAGRALWTVADASTDKVTFSALEAKLEPWLARKSLRPAPVGATPDLIITVHWGVTYHPPRIVPRDEGVWAVPGVEQLAWFEDAVLEHASCSQLSMLGGLTVERGPGGPVVVVPPRGYPVDGQIAVPLQERYYLIFQAFDYRSTVDRKRGEWRWRTCLSIPAKGEDFARQFENILQSGAKYFGENARVTVKLAVQGKVNPR